MGVRDPVCPLPHCLGYGVFEGRSTGSHRMHRRTEQTHLVDIQRLTLRILLAHEYLALHAHQCRCRRRRHTVLACTGLRDDTGLSHFLRQQYLTEHVVDLMRTGVVQILTLQIDLCAAEILRHMCRVIQAGRTACILIKQLHQLPVKLRVIFIMKVRLFQLDHCVHQCLWNVLATVDSKSSF